MRHRGQHREPDLAEQATDQARADHLSRRPAAEAQHAPPEAGRQQGQADQVDRELDHVAQVVAEPDRRHGLAHHPIEVGAAQPVRSADAEVVVRVLRERGGHHTVGQRLDHQMARVVAEVLEGQVAERPLVADQLVSDVERRMGPRAVGQELDDERDPLVALDQHDVALAQHALQQIHVVRVVLLVVPHRLVEEPGGARDERFAKTFQHGGSLHPAPSC